MNNAAPSFLNYYVTWTWNISIPINFYILIDKYNKYVSNIGSIDKLIKKNYF